MTALRATIDLGHPHGNIVSVDQILVPLVSALWDAEVNIIGARIGDDGQTFKLRFGSAFAAELFIARATDRPEDPLAAGVDFMRSRASWFGEPHGPYWEYSAEPYDAGHDLADWGQRPHCGGDVELRIEITLPLSDFLEIQCAFGVCARSKYLNLCRRPWSDSFPQLDEARDC